MTRGTLLLLTLLLISSESIGQDLIPQSMPVKESDFLRSWNPRTTPIVHVVAKLKNAVVNIHSEKTDNGINISRVSGMGTGIIIDQRGYVVTNYHVIEDVLALKIRLADGSTYHARVLARDAETDLALLKFEPSKPLQVAPIGTAKDLMVGETVIAIGNAFGYEHTVTVGVVSATNRDVSLNKDLGYKALIQTDASINPGNSGGPLLNVLGEVVGLNVAIRREAQGIGFAIPAETLIKVSGEMMAGRRRKWNSGLTLKDVLLLPREEMRPLRKLVVEKVENNSSAALAGIKPGDVLLKVDQLQIDHSLDWERCLIEKRAGDSFEISLDREGRQILGKLSIEKPAAWSSNPEEIIWSRLGVKYTQVSGEQISKVHPQLHGGLQITEIKSDGNAAKAGIQKGDTLIGLHQWEMLSSENLIFVLNNPDLSSLNPVRFFVLRNGQLHRGFVDCQN